MNNEKKKCNYLFLFNIFNRDFYFEIFLLVDYLSTMKYKLKKIMQDYRN